MRPPLADLFACLLKVWGVWGTCEIVRCGLLGLAWLDEVGRVAQSYAQHSYSTLICPLLTTQEYPKGSISNFGHNPWLKKRFAWHCPDLP